MKIVLSIAEIRNTFTKRLVSLCRTQSSVSHVCKETGINRQQFAKYLSGVSVPSLENAFKIADFFDISVDELLTGKQEQRRTHEDYASGFSPYASKLVDEIRTVEQLSDVSRFTNPGYYLTYINSFRSKEWDNRWILVCLVHLTNEGNTVFYDRRHYATHRHKQDPMSAKYYGTGQILHDRLYLRYVDSTNRDSIGMLMLQETGYMSSDMNGLQLALAATQGAEPAASRVYFRYLGEKPDLRSAIRKCGMFRFEEISDAEVIINWITQPKGDDDPILWAL